jgi:hypothetical protein
MAASCGLLPRAVGSPGAILVGRVVANPRRLFYDKGGNNPAEQGLSRKTELNASANATGRWTKKSADAFIR